jgi:hypothetical protein
MAQGLQLSKRESIDRARPDHGNLASPNARFPPFTTHAERQSTMALSDQLTKLAARAKEAEDHAAAAQTKARAELEKDVKTARDSAKAQADRLSKAADAGKGKLSAWWESLQRSWNEHVAEIRQNIDEKRGAHDLDVAQRQADSAEEDAAFAIDYAYGAIEEAEYAVLDATLARMEADELAAQNR